ncbi:GTPase-associated system all-helical protein GASH [Pseudoalteromonas prydzensis]|uniref:GTPase-associated system all-helical protein GASH n=1 Tax=Pseudoalteromonas prydzensis TaxID=182141 RepID=UPI0024BC0D53|nr:GTPase-associated system all-helical protein GASH [Pseudoalteromonas prydzensis]
MSDNDETLPTAADLPAEFIELVRPIKLSDSREDVLRRWKTISRIFVEQEDAKILTENVINDLISSSIDKNKISEDKLKFLHQEFTLDDFMYPKTPFDVEEEIRVLSSYCLLILTDNNHFSIDFVSKITTNLLSASLGGLLKFKGSYDFETTLNNKVFEYTREQRSKNVLPTPVLKYQSLKRTTEAKEKFDDNPQDVATISEYISSLHYELGNQLIKANQSITNYANQVNKVTDIMDEELEILWMVNLRWCDYKDISFDDLTNIEKIIYLAYQLSEKTYRSAELPSVKAIANMTGIENENVTLRDFIDSNHHHIEELVDFSHISDITPILFGIKLASEGSWASKWKNEIGLDSKTTINSFDLTIQLYREFLTIGWVQH